MSELSHNANKSFYDRIASSYDALANANEHRAREAGEQLLNLQPGESVLEIGFGTGNSLVNLANAVGVQGCVAGIDVSDGMKDVAEAKLEQAGQQHVDLQVGDAISLPWPNDTFDAVFLSFTLELFDPDDIPTVLSECRRVLKPAGRLATVSMATVKKEAGETASVLEKTYIWMHRNFPHIVDCRPIDPASELASAGFDVTAENRLAIWTMPVAAVLGTNTGDSHEGDFAI